jgi:membrane protease subunit HflK
VVQAEADKVDRIQRATGEAQKFLQIYRYYQRAPEVTRTRLYLQTLERILPKVHKIIVDTKGAGTRRLWLMDRRTQVPTPSASAPVITLPTEPEE